MTKSSNAVALITPLKDELSNIDNFISHIENQTIPITCLVIVENDSTDGSKEYLDKIESVKNVEFFKVVHLSFDDKSYRVGKKYATIIKTGMNYLKELDLYNSLDFIGILDSDIFPEKEYYEKLTTFLKNHSEIGITSGLIFTQDGKLHIANKNFVRGGCRVWKKKCLEEAGYIIAHTADTVSVALAHLNGWKTKTMKSAKVTSREVNVRIANSYNKGYHAYYRGHTLIYVFLKALFFGFRKGEYKMGFEYLAGYLKSMRHQKPQIEDEKLRKYFKFYLYNKIIRKFD